MKNKKHILIVLLLVVVILFNSFVPASAELVLTASVCAVIGTLLVASGMTFNSDSSMTAAVKSFWNSLDSDAKAAVVVIADQYAEFRSANPLKKFVFKATSSIVSAISGWLQGLGVSDGSTSVSVPTGTALSLPVTITFASLSMIQKDSLDDLVSLASSDDVFEFLPGFYLVKVFLSSETNLCMLRLFYLTASGSYYLIPQFRFMVSFPDSETPADAFNFAHYSNNSTPINISLGSSASSIRFSVPVTNGSDNTYIYSDANYFVNGGSSVGSVSIPLAPDYIPAGSGSKPLDSACDVVVPGGLINADTGALDSDLVGTMTPDAVRDASTDTDVPDVGILTGIRDIVGNIAGTISGTIADLLTAIQSGISSIADTLARFFDVSNFSLDFSPFQIGLTKVFPFCIPFDLYNGVKLFAVQSSDFSFDIKLDTDFFKIDHTVDLAPFKLPIMFFRYIVVFWFSWILISRTRDLMKW